MIQPKYRTATDVVRFAAKHMNEHHDMGYYLKSVHVIDRPDAEFPIYMVFVCHWYRRFIWS